LSIAVCTGMVAATFSPSVRRSIPRWFEIALWVALIVVCWLGIASINQPQVRELTDSVNWAVAQILNTLLGLAGASVLDTLLAHRFAIANAVVTLYGACLLALALASTRRVGLGWQPRVRLRDWMELPRAAAPAPVMLAGPSAVDDLNERLAAATAVAGAAAATWSVQFLIWARDVGLPRAEARLALAAAVGRVETKVWLESVRETARELDWGAPTRFAATSGAEVNKLALRVAAILNGVVDAEQRIKPGAHNLAQVVDLQALRIAQTLSRLDRAASNDEKEDESGTEHTDKLAS
jgi:hypothetical protein